MPEPVVPPMDARSPTNKTLDTKTIEVLALSVFRSIFGRAVRVPIKVPGMMDMDLVVRDNNVILNLNKIEVHAPELLIWRVVFAYQGKPVVEYGRGIPNDMKIHLPQLCFLYLAIWRDKRKLLKARAAANALRDREMIALSKTGKARIDAEEAMA
jgi:hypothetical protein